MNPIACLALLFLLIPIVVSADESVRAVQTKLRQDGFYFGDATGNYDDDTAAAVTRYQIRNGLPITGKIDEATAKALHVSPASENASATPRSLQGTWRQLRNGEHQFVPNTTAPEATAQPVAPSTQKRTKNARTLPVQSPPAPPRRAEAFDRERLRDYVAAFVLAGLDPKVGAELEFFADRVKYFDDGNFSRDRIRRDLVRYDSRWPDRRFWLAGELTVRPQANGHVRVTFPLRYELRSRSDRASGTVQKTLVLQKTPQNDLEIVAVNERKMR